MTAPTPPQAPHAALTAPAVPPEPHTKASVSASEAEQMMGWLKQDLAQGRISPEHAQKAFDQLNASAEQRLPDTRSAEERQIDAAFPVANPEEFTIRWNAIGDDTPMSPETKTFDTQARGWLTAMGFSRENGQAVINLIAKLAQQKMTPAQVDAHVIAENAKLEHLYKDTWEERFEPASRMIHEVDARQPGLKAFLRANGVGDTTMIVNLLIQQAQRYHARKR